MHEPVDAIRILLRCAFVGLLSAGVSAQVGPLNPTVSTVIPVPAGGLHYSSINIPAGVVVNFMEIGGAGVIPAVIRCDGDAIVDGALSVSAELLNGIGVPGGSGRFGEGLRGWTCNFVRSCSCLLRVASMRGYTALRCRLICVGGAVEELWTSMTLGAFSTRLRGLADSAEVLLLCLPEGVSRCEAW